MESVISSFKTENPREAAVVRALLRAYKEGVHARIHGITADFNQVAAWYGTGERPYRVQVTCCDCAAGKAGLMCKHRAALADKTGVLDQLIPNFYLRAFGSSPVDPAPAVTVIELEACPDCHGDGYRRSYYGGHFSDWYAIDCHTCAKTGQVSRELVAA